MTATRPGVVIGRTNLPIVHEGEGLFNIGHLEGTKAIARALDAFDAEDHGDDFATSMAIETLA